MGMVSGYLASISVAGVTYSDFASSATFDTTRDALDKTKLGQSRRTYLSALGDASLSVELHADTTLASALEAAYQATEPVTYVFRPGALGTADLGQYSGSAIMTDRSIAGDATGEWDVSVQLQGSGDYVYTQPA